MISPFKSIFAGLVTLIGALFLLYLAIDATKRNHRLQTNPHTQARVERTWTTSGKHASRYADLSFPRAEGGPLCHASQVRLGPASVPATAGQRIDVVPIPGSCEAPDAPTAAQPALLLTMQYVLSFCVFLVGMMQCVAMPLPFQRRYA